MGLDVHTIWQRNFKFEMYDKAAQGLAIFGIPPHKTKDCNIVAR
jgi:hypothetical protein